MEYPKLRFTEEQRLGFKRFISEKATFVRPMIMLGIVKEDPADNRILECAMVGKADFVISGDEHLLAIGKIGETKIVTASEFLRPS